MKDTNNVSKRTVTLRLDAIIADPALQMREALDAETINDYASERAR